MPLLQLLFDALVLGSTYALVAVSFSLIVTATRVFHFAHGGVFVVGAYIGFLFITQLQLGLWAGFIAAGVVCSLLGFLLNVLVYERLMRVNSPFIVIAVASLGLTIVLENLVGLVFSPRIEYVQPRWQLLEWSGQIGTVIVTAKHLAILAITLLLLVVFWLFLTCTKAGLAMRAMSNDAELATIMGLPSARYRNMTFAVGSGLVGVSAVLISLETVTINPFMGTEYVLMAMVAMILAGMGNITASILGGLVVGLLQYAGSWYVSDRWSTTMMFIVMVVMLLVRPNGLFGKPVSWLGR